jgi:4-hydroxybenzoate polyprenyltransferase
MIRAVRQGAHVTALCLTEARPCVLVAFLLRFIASRALVTGTVQQTNAARGVAAAFAWEASIFSIYLFNGVMDVQEDRINGSRRPIARGALPVNVAAWVAACAGAGSLAVSLVLGARLVWLVAAVLAIGYLYSGPPCYLKRRAVGTAAVGAALGPLTYCAGFTGYAAGWAYPGTSWLTFVVAMSLWMGLVGVPAKDLADIKGDRAAGRRTLPVIWGEPRARVVIAICAVLVGGAFCLAALSLSRWLAAPAVVLCAGGGAVTAACASRRSRGDRTRLRLPYRMFMITQFAVHLSLLTSVTLARVLTG